MTKARDLADGVINTAELADGSITTAKIADGDITDAKLATGISASKLSGALPAISGAALTGISAGLTGPRAEVFTSSGTFTVPSGVTAVKVTVVGGGGAGGCGVNTAYHTGMGGGGGGGTAIEWITGLTAGDTVSVTVGAGGTGTYSGFPTGSTGGTSSFGAYCSATGGSYGNTTGGDNTFSSGGQGGDGSGGSLNIKGGRGGFGVYNSSEGRATSGGGAAPLCIDGWTPHVYISANTSSYSQISVSGPFGGSSGQGVYYLGEGGDATGYGCGGGGVSSQNSTYNGGAGYQGIVIVEY